jgi:branched-chain amino acid transport system ATP-binding protein
MLSVRDIQTHYGASQALFGLSLEVGAHEVVTLMGRNGMGKTTTVHSIMGITPVTSGEIEFEGRRIEASPSFRIGQAGIGLVPEGPEETPFGISTACWKCSRPCGPGSPAWAICYPAESSRCWPSDGR